jgi:hypothetical protein
LKAIDTTLYAKEKTLGKTWRHNVKIAGNVKTRSIFPPLYGTGHLTLPYFDRHGTKTKKQPKRKPAFT